MNTHRKNRLRQNATAALYKKSLVANSTTAILGKRKMYFARKTRLHMPEFWNHHEQLRSTELDRLENKTLSSFEPPSKAPQELSEAWDQHTWVAFEVITTYPSFLPLKERADCELLIAFVPKDTKIYLPSVCRDASNHFNRFFASLFGPFASAMSLDLYHPAAPKDSFHKASVALDDTPQNAVPQAHVQVEERECFNADFVDFETDPNSPHPIPTSPRGTSLYVQPQQYYSLMPAYYTPGDTTHLLTELASRSDLFTVRPQNTTGAMRRRAAKRGHKPTPQWIIDCPIDLTLYWKRGVSLGILKKWRPMVESISTWCTSITSLHRTLIQHGATHVYRIPRFYATHPALLSTPQLPLYLSENFDTLFESWALHRQILNSQTPPIKSTARSL